MCTLKQLKRYQSGIVCNVSNSVLKQKLIDMGIIPGTSVMISNVSPFGDPIEICLRGYELSLRRHEAEQIIVEC